MPDHHVLTLTTGARVVRDYYMAVSVDEALAYLLSHQGDAQLVAGGTALMPKVQQGAVEATCLVDVSRIGSLRRCKLDEPYLVVGGGMTLAQLQRDETVAELAPILAQGAERIGTPKVRRLATLAGNLVMAHGSSPHVVALVALDAQIEIANTTGSQWLPYRSTVVRAGVSRIDATSEMVTAVRLAPLADQEGMAVGSLPPSGDGYQADLTLALVLGLTDDDKAIDWCTCAYGRPDHAPDREPEIEKRLTGADVDAPATVDSLAGLLVRAMEVDDTPAQDAGDVHDLAEDVYRRAVAMARRGAKLTVADEPDA